MSLLLVACAGGGDYRHLPLAPDVALADTPFFPQQAYQCGPAALATVLNHAGATVTPAALTPFVYIPERAGSLQADMLVTPARYRLLGVRIEATLPALLELVAAGYPVVVLQNLGVEALPVWHYAVVYGYNLEAGRIRLRSGSEPQQSLSLRRFEKTWSRAGYWAMVVVPPEVVPPAVAVDDYLRAVSVLERLQHYALARQAYHAAAVHWPESALAWAGAGNSAYADGDFAGAEADFRQALARSPENPLLMNNLAMTLAERGCRQAALAVIGCAQRQYPDDSLLNTTAAEIRQFAGGDAGCEAYRCPFALP